MEKLKKKSDKLEKELEKFVIRTLENAYNADGNFTVTNQAGSMFAEALKALVELRTGKVQLEAVTFLDNVQQINPAEL